jgi:uncharacterized protein with HEPN domain
LIGIACVPSSKPLHRLADIVDNIDSIQRYIAELDRNAFVANQLVVDAVERCLTRISEAAVKLGDEATRRVPSQPWTEIRGLGNHLRHGYDTLRHFQIWDIVVTDLPSLRIACEAALKKANFIR